MSGEMNGIKLGFYQDISTNKSTNATLASENTCSISIRTRRTNTEATQAQAQGSQRFRLPSFSTSRGAGIENSVQKLFSSRACVLVLMWLVFSFAYLYVYAYVLVKTRL